MQPIATHLAFATQAGEAVNLYVSLFASVFGNSRILKTTYYGTEELEALREVPEMSEDIMPGPPGSAKTIRFLLNGTEFLAINGGGYFGKFTESISLHVSCETQEQIDKLWVELSAGGIEQPCGWLRDRYGVSWQIAPSIVLEIEESPDHDGSQRALMAMYGMKKLDIGTLKRAYYGQDTA